MLEANAVSVAYGNVLAVRGVSFAVPESSVVALLGRNGAGKSTVLRALSGLLRPVSGEMVFDGHRLNRLPANRIVHLGLVHAPEGRCLFPILSVIDHLKIAYFASGRRHGRSLRESLEWAWSLFPQLGERMHQRASTLSGGEQQMLVIARALVAEPRLLMIDELSLGLAPQVVAHLYRVLSNLKHEQGLTMLLVEQFVERALHLADYVYVLQQGSIVFHGTPAEVQDSGALLTSYLGQASEKKVRG